MAQQQRSKAMHITLWVAQGILAVTLIWASSMKLFQPAEKLAAMWPWTADNRTLVKVTGILDLLAGIGLILPALLRIKPMLTIYAAYGTIALMLAAILFHVARGEGSQTGINIFFIVFAAFIAWGRKNKAPVV